MIRRGTPAHERLDIIAAAHDDYPAGLIRQSLVVLKRPDIAFVDDARAGSFIVGASDPAMVDAFRSQGLPVIADAFESGEIGDRIYVDFGTPDLDDDDGGFNSFLDTKTPLHHMGVSKDHIHDVWPLVHEMVHYTNRKRHGPDGLGRGWKGEALVDLETLARVPRAEIDRYERFYRENGHVDGYYQFFEDPIRAIHHDRVLLTGSLDAKLKGDAAHARALAVFDQSEIARIATLPPKSGRGTPRSMRVTLSRRAIRAPRGATTRTFIVRSGRKTVTVTAIQRKGVAKADMIGYLTRRLGAKAVWECRGCRKVRVA